MSKTGCTTPALPFGISENAALMAVLFLSAAIRLWVFAVTENGIDFHFNAYDRALFTWHNWMHSTRWVPMSTYGPFHYYLLRGLFLLTGYDAIYRPTLLSLAAGVFSIWPLMTISKRSFGARVALWTGLGAAFYPLGVRLSSVSLEMTTFMLVLLLAVWQLQLGTDKKRPGLKPVLLSALFLNLACATRFEGWLLIPFFTAILLSASFWRAILFGAVAGIFPVVWMTENYFSSGSPFAFATISAAVQKVHLVGFSIFDTALGWPVIFLRTTTLPIVIFMAIGLVAAFKAKKGRDIAFIGLGLFALFIVFTMRGTMALNETKYILSVGMLLMPFFGKGIEWAADKTPIRTRNTIPFVVIFVVGIFSLATIQIDNRRFAPPKQVNALCDYLEKQDEPKGKILLGVRFQGYILVHGGLPYDRYVLVPGDDSTGRRSSADFWRIVSENAPCLLIHNDLPDRLDFQELLPIDGKKTVEATINGYHFNTVFNQYPWMVVSVEKSLMTQLQTPGE